MTSSSKPGSSYAWLILVACLGFYAIPIGIVGNTSGIFVTPVMDEFGWDRTTATLYMTIQPWVAALFTPFAGQLMARYNPRWLLTGSVLVYGLATVWTAYATQPWQWHAYGVIYGVTCSFFMFLAVPTLINAWFKKSAGVALGIVGAALSLLAAVTSKMLGSYIAEVGWQHARLVLGIVITIVPTLLAAIFIRKSPESMGVTAWGEGEATTTATAAPATGATVEQARRSPAFYLLILSGGFLVMCASFFQQIPSFAATGSLGAAAGATAVSIIMVGGVLGKFLLGWMADQFGIKITGVFAGLAGAAGLVLALVAGSNTTVFYVGLGIFGIGYSALTVVAPMLAREGFGTANYPKIYSWVSTGIFVGSGLAALTYARIYDMTKSFTPAFIMVIAMYVLVAAFVPYIARVAPKSWKGQAAPVGQPVG